MAKDGEKQKQKQKGAAPGVNVSNSFTWETVATPSGFKLSCVIAAAVVGMAAAANAARRFVMPGCGLPPSAPFVQYNDRKNGKQQKQQKQPIKDKPDAAKVPEHCAPAPLEGGGRVPEQNQPEQGAPETPKVPAQDASETPKG